ncbi:5'-nucleotidase [Micromonospora phaseoli]|uniref:5'-nucleotidase n=1 Tax=Micromonospora phaseoli TaxID=1144548 RepID=A0A1H7CCT6_9ACTN|nr:5'/3'-nucleotidase SurE [Micromonospora phaseoli]PZV97906.1 5'-nucleotidase [Micromonospora phaseoli]GIJ78573.1 5'/3'-nucleotidase SurE [Micromonospora phaseoli]SEJ87501.1 5'-nucleotidase [Micromonospora phaseoli]
MTLRVLITNDDGIAAPGIQALAWAAVQRGLDVVVAAPLEEASGTSAAMSAVEQDGQVVVREHPLPELDGVPAFGVGGSPGFIALIAVHGAFGPPPSVLLSGINRGANAGRAVLHSGTVGAAFTAAANGCRAMAVSLDVLSVGEATSVSGGAAVAAAALVRDAERNWATAARVALDLLPRLTAGPAESVLNVNSPDLPFSRLRGVRRGTLATFGQVQMTVAESGHGFVRTSLEEPGQAVQPGTDLALLADGYASVTAVRAVTEVADVDLSGLGEG